MAAFIKPKGKDSSFWKVSSPNREVTQSGWGMDLGAPMTVKTMSDELIEDGAVKPNQKVVLHFGEVYDTKYHTAVRVNPAIARVATIVGYPSLLEPGDRAPIDIYLKADKAFSVSDYSWLVRLYPID